MKAEKIIISIVLILGILLFCNTVNAAGIGMSINPSSVTEGGTFTVTISGINGKVNISSNSNVTISPSGTQWVEGSLTINGTAKSVGTGTVTVTPVNVSTTGADPQKVTASASKNITIKARETSKPTDTTKTTTNTKTNTNTNTKKNETKVETKKSSNASLSSLSIEGFSLFPEFNKATTKYSITVNQDVNNLDIKLSTEDSKSKYEISGNSDFVFGTNTVNIKVTAEDGTKKEYALEVNKVDTTIGLSSLSISDENKDLSFSPKFDKNTLNYMLDVENTSELYIDADANHEDATISVIGNSDLKNGENIITITVQKDEEIKVYTITVNNTITHQSFTDKIATWWSNSWIVFIISICSLIQSSIAIYFVSMLYIKTNSKK